VVQPGNNLESAEVRSYRDEDRQGFTQLVSEVLAEYGFQVDPVLEADLDDPQNAYGAVWVAEDGDKVIGSVAVRLLGDGAQAELKRMYLRPTHRGRGIGRSLLSHAIDWAASQGCHSVVLDTSASMLAAQGLYRSVGFVQTGTRTENGSRHSRCEVLYKLDLRPPSGGSAP
jgi:putative acetyltransferase